MIRTTTWWRAWSTRIRPGMTIRGAKMLGTSSIMANEVFVANLQPLKPGEEDLAFCCAVPMGSKGLRVLSRKSYESSAVSVYDNPLSSRFDENDAMIYFDDVKVRLGSGVRAPRRRHVPGSVSRHAWPHLSELSVADPAGGEAEVPGRARAPPHGNDRHLQHAAGARAARPAGRAGRHGRGDDARDGGRRRAIRRMVDSQPAPALLGAGA